MPPLVTQIADGENGGVMMNEFPPKYLGVIRECSGTRTPAMNVTEYLERLRSAGKEIYAHADSLSMRTKATGSPVLTCQLTRTVGKPASS